MITYKCKLQKKYVSGEECKECWGKNNKDTRKFGTRANCTIRSVDYLGQLKDLTKKKILDRDISFLKLCKNRGFLAQDKKTGQFHLQPLIIAESIKEMSYSRLMENE